MAEPGKLKKFKLPFAINGAGRLVAPHEANKCDPYTCPGCAAAVSLHAGKIKAHHFHHQPSAECSPETVEHALAKRIISTRLREWMQGQAQPPLLRIPCPRCGQLDQHRMGGRFDEVVEEYTLSNGLRPDVVALRDGEPVVGVEVQHTHAVNDEKAGRLGLRFIEVRAGEVIASPDAWLVVRSSRKTPCGSCKERELRKQHEAARIAASSARREAHRRQVERFAASLGLESFDASGWKGILEDAIITPCRRCRKNTIWMRLPDFGPFFTLDRESMADEMRGIDPRLWEPRIVYSEWKYEGRWWREKGWLVRPVIICLHCGCALRYRSSYATKEEWDNRPRRQRQTKPRGSGAVQMTDYAALIPFLKK